MSNAPLDTSFRAYFELVALCYSTMIFGAAAGIVPYAPLLVIPAIAVNAIYLFTVPGAYEPFRQVGGEIPIQQPPSAVPYTGMVAAPAQPTAQDLYAAE